MVPVTVYSDYVCPFCYMGYASLERARESAPLAPSWRAFELRPAGAPPMDPAYRARIEQNWPRVQAMGREYGVAFDAPLRVGVNSRAAHRAMKIVARLAPEVAEDYHGALFRAHFTDGKDISDPEVLVALAEPFGVEGEALRSALASGEAEDEVLEEQAEARAMEISGVPAFLFLDKYLVSGLIPPEQILSAVEEIRRLETGA